MAQPTRPDRFPGGRLLRPGVWELRFSLGPDPVLKQANGRPVYRRRSVSFKAATKTAAKAEWARLNDEVRPRTVKRTDATFGLLFDRWLTTADLSESTVNTHQILYDRHLAPILDTMRLRDVTTDLLEEVYARLHRPKPAGAGLSASSVRRVHSVVDGALKRAMAWEWLDRNPAEYAKPPRVHGKPVTYTPTLQELHRALLAANDMSPTALALVWTAAATGMRRGELCGLQWVDVDGQNRVIHVRRNIVDVGGHVVDKAPKTGKTRMVEIPAELVVVLAAYQESVTGPGWNLGLAGTRTDTQRPTGTPHHKVAPAAGAAGTGEPQQGSVTSPWLWTGERGDRVRPDKLTGMWNLVRSKAGIPAACRLHDLRHAYGSILTAAGGEGTVAAVAAQLGHGDMSTTMRHYLSAQTDDRRVAADLIGRLLAGTTREGT